jgi:hypothetical protein
VAAVLERGSRRCRSGCGCGRPCSRGWQRNRGGFPCGRELLRVGLREVQIPRSASAVLRNLVNPSQITPPARGKAQIGNTGSGTVSGAGLGNASRNKSVLWGLVGGNVGPNVDVVMPRGLPRTASVQIGNAGLGTVSCCRFSGRLVKLIPPCARTQQG